MIVISLDWGNLPIIISDKKKSKRKKSPLSINLKHKRKFECEKVKKIIVSREIVRQVGKENLLVTNLQNFYFLHRISGYP